MYKREPDAVLEALDDSSLRDRLTRTDWERDPLFIADEQVFSLFRRARAKGDTTRIGLFAEAFNVRLLERSRKFVLRARIFPGLIDDLKRARTSLPPASGSNCFPTPMTQSMRRRRLDSFLTGGLLASSERCCQKSASCSPAWTPMRMMKTRRCRRPTTSRNCKTTTHRTFSLRGSRRSSARTTKGAEAGDASSQALLGTMYSDGLGVIQDQQQALMWYRRAGIQGSLLALRRLGEAYMNGAGVRKDLVVAYALLNLAASDGNEGATQSRNRVAAQLTPEQLREGQMLSRWKVGEKLPTKSATWAPQGPATKTVPKGML